MKAWMAIAVLMVIVVILVGVSQYYLVGRSIRRRFQNIIYNYAATVGGLVTMILMFVESHAELVRFFDSRRLPNESDVYSVLFVPVFVIFSSVIFGVFLQILGLGASRSRLAYLRLKKAKT